LFLGVANDNQVCVAMQRLTPRHRIIPRDQVISRRVAAIHFADMREVCFAFGYKNSTALKMMKMIGTRSSINGAKSTFSRDGKSRTTF